VRNLHSIWSVALKEWRELLRDPITLGVALLVPLALLVIFGYGLNLDVEGIPIAIVDQDQTVESRAYADALDRSREFRTYARTTELRGVERLLDRGKARALVVVPAGFGRAVRGSDRASVQFLVDGTFSATAQVIAAYLESFTADYAPRAGGPAPRPAGTEIASRVAFNPGLDTAQAVIPGLFGVILMAFPPLLTALAIVREKERGSIKQILISPVAPWAFIGGKLIPYMVVGIVDAAVVFWLGTAWFDIPVRGSLFFFAAATVVYLFATLGVGLLVSTIARTQVVALLLVLVLTVMPSFMFSGFLYPIFNMPPALQYYTTLFPGRYFVELSRGILLKGAGLTALYPSLALLAGYGVLVTLIASLRLRARVE